MLTQKAVKMSITVPQNPRIIEGFFFLFNLRLKNKSQRKKRKKEKKCVPKQILANYESDNGLNRPTALNTWGVYLEIKLCLPFIQKTPTQRGRE